jgi:Asp-tRNA(Asn)/Glu-tRNA(Gln) amidotransferase A subunit family amidase
MRTETTGSRARFRDPYGAFVSAAPVHGRVDGVLTGVDFCVKDNISVKGQPFTAGHPLFAGRRGLATAPAVERLLQAGARMVGMTRTDSGGFGMTSPGVENPVLPGHTVGGSSGGAAAAVAAGLADLGLGTDTGGSIRIPAACTGLFGFKPTIGRAPTDGIWPLAPSFDHVGLLSRELHVLSAAARVLLNERQVARGRQLPSPEAAFSITPAMDRALVIAIEHNAPWFAEPGIEASMRKVKLRLLQAGHRLERAELPNRDELASAFGCLVLSEAREFYEHLPTKDRSKLGPAASRALSTKFEHSDLARAKAIASRARTAIEACLADVDVLLSPTLFLTPPGHGKYRVNREERRVPIVHAFLAGTCFANVAGTPALAMPLEDRVAALPFSLHLTARRDRDFELFNIAERLMRDCRNDLT